MLLLRFLEVLGIDPDKIYSIVVVSVEKGVVKNHVSSFSWWNLLLIGNNNLLDDEGVDLKSNWMDVVKIDLT